jgi:hypothetical protein
MALSSVFPLILITMALEHRRAIRVVDRRERVFKQIVEFGIMGSLIGLVTTAIGVQTNGLNFPFAVLVWFMFALGVFGLGVMLVAIVEKDRDDRADEIKREQDEEERQRLHAMEAERRAGVWWRRRIPRGRRSRATT